MFDLLIPPPSLSVEFHLSVNPVGFVWGHLYLHCELFRCLFSLCLLLLSRRTARRPRGSDGGGGDAGKEPTGPNGDTCATSVVSTVGLDPKLAKSLLYLKYVNV